MYVIIWKYGVRAEHIVEFEQFYHPGGMWARLFKRGDGYLGTELLRDLGHHQRYVTIDRWASSRDYESFLSQWKKEYEELDGRCEGLTEQEMLLGKWETIDHRTR